MAQEALGTVQEALGTAQEALGTAQEALGTVQEALGTAQEGRKLLISNLLSPPLQRCRPVGVGALAAAEGQKA